MCKTACDKNNLNKKVFIMQTKGLNFSKMLKRMHFHSKVQFLFTLSIITYDKYKYRSTMFSCINLYFYRVCIHNGNNNIEITLLMNNLTIIDKQ